MIIKECLICKKSFYTHLCYIKMGKGKFCSRKCSDLRIPWNKNIFGYSTAKKGKKYPEFSGINHPNWKGNHVGYFGLHDWIEKTMGKAKDGICSFKDITCSKKLNWSNISRKYYRNLSDWQVLCRRHHVRYDMNDKWRQNMSKAMKGRVAWNKGKQGVQKYSIEIKRKISESMKIYKRTNHGI